MMSSPSFEVLDVTEGIAFECPERPEVWLGSPMGMYHCPHCGCMVIAGFEVHPHEFECWLGLWDGTS